MPAVGEVDVVPAWVPAFQLTHVDKDGEKKVADVAVVKVYCRYTVPVAVPFCTNW